MNKELKEEIKTHENLIRKKAEQKYINCQMDRVIETIKEEIIEKIETYFGHISNNGNGKPMIISTKQIGEDLKNLIKEDE